MTGPYEPGGYPSGAGQPGGNQQGDYSRPASGQQGDYQQGGYQQGDFPQDSRQHSNYQQDGDFQQGVQHGYAYYGDSADGGYHRFGSEHFQDVDEQPADRPGRGRRGVGWLIAAGALVLVLVVALVNARRGNQDTALPQPRPTGTATPSPSDPETQRPSGPLGLHGERLPTVSCPQIRDEQAHLAYTCIDNSLAQDDSNTYLDLRIVLNALVEPNWVISEGSGDADAAVQSPSVGVVRFHQEPDGASTTQVMAKVKQRTASAVRNAYGDEPTSRTLSARQRMFGGVLGYELVTEVSMNQAYRLANDLKASKERLWVVGVPTSAGVSIFMMSIPDDRADLWPGAEAIVAGLHVI